MRHCGEERRKRRTTAVLLLLCLGGLIARAWPAYFVERADPFRGENIMDLVHGRVLDFLRRWAHMEPCVGPVWFSVALVAQKF